ncbi:MAG TPA: hypothetical protein VFQ53_23755 [Kofleriaceae bacterium]|nr:hypothetical protein [Kofleriaceae bacterium]
MAEAWLKCTECKTDIPFGGKHYVCSVSTCKRSKMRLVFCSVTCWDSHLSTVRHREAWAEEAIAPSKDAWQRELAESAAPPPAPPKPAVPARPPFKPEPFKTPPEGVPVRRVVGDASQSTAAAVEGLKLADNVEREILIVVSKMKKYIKDRSGMNCSDAVAEMLSDHVRLLCDEAIRNAARDERKTVLDRDVTRPRR